MRKIHAATWFFASIFALDMILILLHYLWGGRLGFFNLDREQNLASVYSGFKLMTLGGLSLVLGWLARLVTKGRFISALWVLAGAGFIFIGLDDMMAIHERVGFVLNNWTGLGGFYGESFNWLIYFSPLVALALLIYLRLIQSVWEVSRPNALWMLIGTIIFSLSLVSEIVGARLILAPVVNTKVYFQAIVIEEFLEMIGATCFFIGLAREVARIFSRVFMRTHS